MIAVKNSRLEGTSKPRAVADRPERGSGKAATDDQEAR